MLFQGVSLSMITIYFLWVKIVFKICDLIFLPTSLWGLACGLEAYKVIKGDLIKKDWHLYRKK
jgi:hypothetical protein